MQSQQARFLKSLVLTPARGCIGLESKPLECEGLAADKGRGGDGGGATAGSGEHQTSGCSEARRRDWVEEGGWRTACENAHCCKDSEDQALQSNTSLKSFLSTEKRPNVKDYGLTIIFMIKLLGGHCTREACRWLFISESSTWHGVCV